VLTIERLAGLLDSSLPTARNRLKTWGAFTSYNRKGSSYALPGVPTFDQHGLWKYQGAFFSRHGTLKRTVEYLVSDAEMGLDAAQISALLGLPPSSFMAQLPSLPGLMRQKYRGRFVYFAAEPPQGQRQQERRAASEQRLEAVVPADGEAIAILVDRIKHPDSSEQQSAARLRKRGITVSGAGVRALLIYHGVEKKTAAMRLPERSEPISRS
jgi:hypothetical protein